MSTALAAIVAGTIGLFVGILIGKGSQERRIRRAEKRKIAALESRLPRAIRLDSYKRSS